MVTVFPLITTFPLPTAIVSIVVPEPFLIIILPVPALIFSLNVRTILLSIATFPWLSVGVEELKVGAWVSAKAPVVKLNVVLFKL